MYWDVNLNLWPMAVNYADRILFLPFQCDMIRNVYGVKQRVYVDRDSNKAR